MSPDPGLPITLLVMQRRESEDQRAFVAMIVTKKELSLTCSDLYMKNSLVLCSLWKWQKKSSQVLLKASVKIIKEQSQHRFISLPNLQALF